MRGLRVTAVDLRLAAPDSLRSVSDDLRRNAAEDFLPAVLAVAARRLTARFGDEAVIRLPQLDLELRLAPGELLADATIETVGSDIAEAIASRVAAATGAPPGASIVYRSASEREARAITAAAQGQARLAGEPRDFATLWQAFERHQPEQQAMVLVQLSDIKALHPVLAKLSRAALARLLRQVRTAVPLAVRRELTRVAAAKGIVAEAPAPTDIARASPSTADDGIAQAETPSRGPAFVSKPGAAATAAPQSLQSARAAQESGNVARTRQDRRREDVPETRTAPHTESLAPAPFEYRPAVTQPASGGRDEAARPLVQDAMAEDSGDVSDFVVYESQWCALLGLLNISLACELPERLWRIGVDEGGVLAAIFARLSGTTDDPASRILGRAFPDITPYAAELPEWAERELVDGTIAEAIRLTGDSAIAQRIDALASQYGGAGFDLVAWGAALHLARAETRLGQQLSPDAVAARFARGGQIVVGPDIIRVIQPMDVVDIELRRAGLDRNPGWLAWLAKRLEFVFEEQDDTS